MVDRRWAALHAGVFFQLFSGSPAVFSDLFFSFRLGQYLVAVFFFPVFSAFIDPDIILRDPHLQQESWS